ncbi:CEMIP [Mytilus edulis]|uniref:CEMIP n=1 Tax=Mytilus edulis TaxID=6550 RepID=A0A8S3U8N9_MYTED|nr:CEMIP [Mytilus edulis]
MNEQIDKEKSLKIKKNEDRLKEMANERNQEIQRVVKMEQNIKDLQHKIEKEAEERVEDKTFHAETKTKNTKVHVESAVEDNYTQTEEYLKRKTENSHHRDTCDLLIIGSSIIKDIDGKRLYKNRKVKIITLHDKTVFGAIQYIKSFRDKAKHIMFKIGSNDKEQKTPDEVIEEIEELVRVTQRYNPDAPITFGEILPRVLSDRYYAKFLNEHRLIFKVQLYELCKDLDLHFVRVLNTLLNVKLWENNEYNTKTNHVRDNGIPNYQMTNSMTNRKQRDHQAFEQKSHFNNPIYVGSESAINGRNKTVNMMELMLQEMRTENEISSFSMNGQIVLIGDLNTQTGQRADFIVNESDHINSFDGFDLLPENYITDSEINRNNKDTSVNTGQITTDDLVKSDLCCVDDQGCTTIMLAARHNRIENLKELLDFSLKSVDAQYSNGLKRALDLCNSPAFTKRIKASSSEKGADLRKCHQATGNTVLHLAASLGRLDVLEFLLNFCKPKYGVDVGRFLSSKKRLCVNASNGSDKTATDKGATTALLDFNENLFSVPEYEGVWSEILSHRQRHTDLIMNLIEKDSKPNFEKLKKAWVPGFDHNLRDHHANTPLMVACKVGNVDVVLFLLQSAVYPQSFAEDDSLISEMTENRKVESLLQDISRPSGLSIYHDGFINHICAVNSMDGSTSLHTCLLKGDNFRIMELLLKIDPNDMTVNIQNISGLTPLHLACQLERRKCTEILVNCPETDLNIHTLDGKLAEEMTNNKHIIKIVQRGRRGTSCTIPTTTSDVKIKDGMNVKLDIDVDVNSITIETNGRLVWDSGKNYRTRNEVADKVGCGQKFICVAAGGTLELHGEDKLSWTKLDKTVNPLKIGDGMYYQHQGTATARNDWRKGLRVYAFDATSKSVIKESAFYLSGENSVYTFRDLERFGPFIDSIADGSIVAIALLRQLVGTSDLTDIYAKMESLGAKLIRTIDSDDAYAFIATKGTYYN